MKRRTIAATAAVAALAAAAIGTATATTSGTHHQRLHAAGTPGESTDGVGGSPELGAPVGTQP